MLLPLRHHPLSLPPNTQTVPSLSSLTTKTLFSQKPKTTEFTKKPLIRSSISDPKTQIVPKSAIERIADKLRSLGFTETQDSKPELESNSAGEIFVPLPQQLPKYRVGHTIDTSWNAPENPVPEPGSNDGSLMAGFSEMKMERKDIKRGKERRVPTLAELSLPEEELKRLSILGMGMKRNLKIGKAGITEGIMNGIHERWRRSEVVKIVCEDISKMNMKRTHDLLERKTGGLVVWRSGSKIVLYRGVNYKYPYFSADKISVNDSSPSGLQDLDKDNEELGEADSCASHMDGEKRLLPSATKKMTRPTLVQGVGFPNRVRFQLPGEAELVEEADHLLDGLGPRFTNWWGYEPLPVDGDLLPAVVPGYRRPFRLLPYGVKPILTNDEMTTLKRLGRPLPFHFVLGRNRKLQGLAASIIKLWEKCEIAKIAVKRGVQNTNSEMMAEELKWLTGGTLLSRDKDSIVLYRGKDFLPSAVSSAIEERRKQVIQGEKQSAESADCSVSPKPVPDLKVGSNESCSGEEDGGPQDQKSNLLDEPKNITSAEAAVKRTNIKLSMVLEKKEKAEKLLAELEEAELPGQYEVDKGGITVEERHLLRKVGLRMKPFLLLGRRGVFAGTVENMHLHWKYRELVKIVVKKTNIEAVHRVARTLEAESGGILVGVERISKGYVIIVYRGKNYQRPASLRPQTLLTKREAMKRSLEEQRCKSLKLHILKINQNIDELKHQMAVNKDTNGVLSVDKSSLPLQEGMHFSTSVNAEHCVSDKDPIESSSELTKSKMDISISPGVDNMIEGMHFSTAVKADHCVSDKDPVESSSEITKNKLDVSISPGVDNVLNMIAPGAISLSNKDRLLLRKQALKMRKRPILAVGRSNIVTGVAKAIKEHFKKHPLAIVNVKGRAKGTSVQEVVLKLQEATGAIFVSQEPSKVILYRGWGADDVFGEADKGNARDAGKTSTGREIRNQPAVSPDLMAAIKLECGLSDHQKEEAT
ncbi:hypothetical protein SLEP1_g20211 [Rubroshorea leprosula]|uniref:CRM domain-containing protein n=1 Tax=Rubroshorea leprosula TaxID=152421 RepID=A0AAV5J9I1_9ROSI|nr:hypothetical protein SLEP1_g20211 [Rubroshorea leprosula]